MATLGRFVRRKGVVITLSLELIVFLSFLFVFMVLYYRSTQLYNEQLFIAATAEVDSLVLDDSIYCAHSKGNQLLLQERTIAGKVLAEELIAPTAAREIDLLHYEHSLNILWQSNEGIHYYDGETKKLSVQGQQPTLLAKKTGLFICWQEEKTLYEMPVEQQNNYSIHPWVVATTIGDFSLYQRGGTAYLCYSKGSTIYYRRNLGVWSEEQLVGPGSKGHLLITNSTNYLYHLDEEKHLRVYYGPQGQFLVQKELWNETTTDIYTADDLLIFVAGGTVYAQYIADEGFSPVFVIGEGTVAHGYNIDLVHSLILYSREGNYYSKMIQRPKTFSESAIPTMDLSSEKHEQYTWWQYINWYGQYNPVFEEEGSIRNWIVAHSTESLIILGFIIALLFLGISLLVQRLYKPKGGKKSNDRTGR